MMKYSPAVLALVMLACTAMCLADKAKYDYTYCQAPNQLEVTQTNYTLELVQTITRHGDRTTLTVLPNYDYEFLCNLTTFMFPSLGTAPAASPPRLYRKNYLPKREVINGNCNMGQLSQKGYDQHVSLGQQLRSLYVDNYSFLSPDLNTTEVWIRSTDIYRTVQSAQANMYGFFPGTPGQAQLPVVDMYTMDLSLENMFSNDATCPRGAQVYAQVMNEPAYQKYNNATLTLANQLAQALGVSVQSLGGWNNLFDAFNVITCYDLPYPAGITKDMVDQIFTIANWEYNYALANTELTKLWIGDFVAELLAAIQAKISGELPQKYMMYSGHDTTIAPLMTAFGVYDGNWPPYCSHSQLELWSNAGQYYVQIKYQGTAQKQNNCGSTMCPLSTFLKNIAPFTITDYAKECAVQQPSKKPSISIL